MAKKGHEKEACLRGLCNPHPLIVSSGYTGYSKNSQEEPGFPPQAAGPLSVA